MHGVLIPELERAFGKCSDCLLHGEYIEILNKLYGTELSQELIDYLCAKATSKKHIWEIRFEHLRALLLNPSSKSFDLKEFYLENLKKSRRLAMKIFYIRGYAAYASEKEMEAVMEKFCKNLEKNRDGTDYAYVLSVAGLPYLADKYGYNCFKKALEKACEEYEKIPCALRGFFTLNESLDTVPLISSEEAARRIRAFLGTHRDESK